MPHLAWARSAQDIARKQKQEAQVQIHSEKALLQDLASQLEHLQTELTKIKIDMEQNSQTENTLHAAQIGTLATAVAMSILARYLYKNKIGETGKTFLAYGFTSSLAYMNTTTLFSYLHLVTSGHLNLAQIDTLIIKLKQQLILAQTQSTDPAQQQHIQNVLSNLETARIETEKQCAESCFASPVLANALFATIGVFSALTYIKTKSPASAVVASISNILGAGVLIHTFYSAKDVHAISAAVSKAQLAIEVSLSSL